MIVPLPYLLCVLVCVQARAKRDAGEKKRLQRHIQEEQGGAGENRGEAGEGRIGTGMGQDRGRLEAGWGQDEGRT